MVEKWAKIYWKYEKKKLLKLENLLRMAKKCWKSAGKWPKIWIKLSKIFAILVKIEKKCEKPNKK